MKLQNDIDQLEAWVRNLGMRFQPVKCNMMQLTRKWTKNNDEFKLEGTILQNIDKIKNLGVTITENLRCYTHVSNICTKANITLGFLRRMLYPGPPRRKGGSLQWIGVSRSSPGEW